MENKAAEMAIQPVSVPAELEDEHHRDHVGGRQRNQDLPGESHQLVEAERGIVQRMSMMNRITRSTLVSSTPSFRSQGDREAFGRIGNPGNCTSRQRTGLRSGS